MRFILLGLLGLLSTAATAQTQLTGRVLTRGTHQPLPQVSVQLAGQPLGATTDADGRFRLTVPAGVSSPALSFSHLGYQPLTVPAAQLGTEVEMAEQSYLIGDVEISAVRLRQLLLRRWKLDSAWVAAQTRKDVDQMCAQHPKLASQREETYQSLFAAIAGQRREYRDKGIVRTWGGISGTNSRLHWQFDEATRTITVAEGLLPTTVLELTTQRLVLQRADGFVYTWVPADK